MRLPQECAASSAAASGNALLTRTDALHLAQSVPKEAVRPALDASTGELSCIKGCPSSLLEHRLG